MQTHVGESVNLYLALVMKWFPFRSPS